MRTHVFEAAGMNETGYLPPKERWANAAPTWLDDYYRHRYIQVCPVVCTVERGTAAVL